MKLIVSIGRLKWCVLFAQSPRQFMMRMRMPNGIGDQQSDARSEVRYGDDGNADITTRQNIQLRGVRIEDVPDIFKRFQTVANQRPVRYGQRPQHYWRSSSGIDAEELFDTRETVSSDKIPTRGRKPRVYQPTPEIQHCDHWWTHSVHAEINDLFIPAYIREQSGRIGEFEAVLTL